jgi:hypothetical protein
MLGAGDGYPSISLEAFWGIDAIDGQIPHVLG